MSKAIIFSRVSTISQQLESQTQQLYDAAIKEGYSKNDIILIEHKESGISLSADEREGIQELREYIYKNNDISLFICWEISRLARRPEIVYSVRDLLLSRHIRWIVLQPYMELIDIHGKQTQMASIMMGIFSSFAESEMQIKKERFARSVAYKKSEGRYTGGGLAYGYRVLDNKMIVIDEEEADIVRKIFKMYISGKSLAAVYNEFKYDSKIGGKSPIAYGTTIRRIIVNRAYIGEASGEEGKERSAVIYPRIISDDIFFKAQERLKNAKTQPRLETKRNSYLNGIIREPNSGRALSVSNASYMYKRNLYNDDNICTIRINVADSVVYQVAKEVRYKIEAVDNEAEKEKTKKEILETDDKIVGCRDAISLADKKIDKAEERIINLKISEEKGDEIIRSIEIEKEDAISKLHYYESHKMNLTAYLHSLDMLNDNSDIDDSYLTDVERKNIVQKYISKVYPKRIDKSTVELRVIDVTGRERNITVDTFNLLAKENGQVFKYQYFDHVKTLRPKKKEE